MFRALQKPMAQLGQVVKSLILNMALHHDPNFPFVFAKCYTIDGFGRMCVSLLDAWYFVSVLPCKEPLGYTEIIIPHVL